MKGGGGGLERKHRIDLRSNEGRRGRVRDGNTELISDRDVASLKLLFHQSLF